MPLITVIPPVVLRNRHRLSPPQINLLYGSRIIEESREEKAEALSRVAEFLRLTDAVTAAGIGFVPLKGPLLSHQLYGDPAARYSHDIDILVEADDLETAARVLADSGYSQLPPLMLQDISRRRKLIKYNHHISFNHPGNSQIIELHWRLMNRPWLGFADIDGLLRENLTDYEFAGRRFTVFSPEFNLLYLVIHGAAHHWGRLKWLEDVHRLQNTKDFSDIKFIDLTEKLKAGRMVALYNRILAEYMKDAKLLPCSTKAPAYMISSVLRAIEGESYHGPETFSEILANLRYASSAYRGLLYKLKLAGTVVTNSLLSGRLSRFMD